MIRNVLLTLILFSYTSTSTAHPFSKMPKWAATSILLLAATELVLDIGTLVQVGILLPEAKSLKDTEVNCNQTILCPQNNSTCTEFTKCEIFALDWQNKTESNYDHIFGKALPVNIISPFITISELWALPVFVIHLITDSIRLGNLAPTYQTELASDETIFLTTNDLEHVQSFREQAKDYFIWSATSLPVHFVTGVGIILLKVRYSKSKKDLAPISA